jgi:DNA-binding transcriptional LysR family regulator
MRSALRSWNGTAVEFGLLQQEQCSCITHVSQQLEQMRGDLDKCGTGLRGHVRLLSNIGAMESLPLPLAVFLAAHPNIDVDLEHHGSAGIVRLIAAGRGDVGMSERPLVQARN